LPVGFGVVLVAVVLPCGDFVDEDLLVGDAAIQTLRRENAEFGLGHVEPAAVLGRVVPFEALDEPAGLGRGKGLIKRGWLVDVEIILHQHDFHRVGTRVGELATWPKKLDGCYDRTIYYDSHDYGLAAGIPG
jgi:hypothetical protein